IDVATLRLISGRPDVFGRHERMKLTQPIAINRDVVETKGPQHLDVAPQPVRFVVADDEQAPRLLEAAIAADHVSPVREEIARLDGELRLDGVAVVAADVGGGCGGGAT